MIVFFRFLVFLLVPIVLFSCASVGSRVERAKIVAISAGMKEVVIKTDYFALTSFSRIVDNTHPIKVYIEGDGFAWVSRGQISGNPTPMEPLTLKLAAIEADLNKDSNIIYLARPCQYSDFSLSVSCDKKYWTGSRFSEEVVDSMNQALTYIKVRNNFTKFDLVGYSGGAAIAVILTAKRDDINSLTTVAGNLNHEAVNNFHKVSPLDDSLNPYDYVNYISDIPQHHFIGDSDDVIPYSVIVDFVESQEKYHNNLAKVVLLEGVTHHKGWEGAWRKILQMHSLFK